ncbi:hypothetical protein V6N11_064959 [Hibiscus sabdariffa]|uniref:Uncharacterized protein n=1 Tax=Hibiscus sabdariffa TaxID=183260 RepID=A0ABR2SIK5_9ROSI
MHKQYSMDTVVLDSTADRSQDTGLQKFMGVDGVEGDVDGVSYTRDAGFEMNEGESFPVSPVVVGNCLDTSCMRHEDLWVLEVSSEMPSWSSDETVSIVN